MGDFNARTGNLNDNYEDSAHGDQHIPIPNTFTNIPNRTRFTWDNKSAKKFANNLLANENDIDEISQRLDAGSIDSTGKIIQDLYFKVAKKTLEQKGGKVNKNWKIRNKSKRWFDLECQELKKGVRTIGRKKNQKAKW